MNIKDIAEIIVKKNYWFQVSIPGTNFSHGKTSVSMALSDSESIEAYILKIASINKASNLFIKVFSPNGSSYKPKGEHLIFLQTPQPVAKIATSVAGKATNVAEPATNVAPNLINVANAQQSFKGLGEAEFYKPKHTPMESKDYIDYKVLQSEHKRLEQYNDECKTRISKLEKKVEDLHEENKALLRDNTVKDDKHSLALERVQLQMEKDEKGGLSGLMGELSANPQLIETIIGFINPKHPMFNKEKPQAVLEGPNDESVREIKFTEDKATNEVLNDMPRKLSQKDGDTIGAIYLLFQEFINKPETLVTAVNTFLPQFNQQS